MIHNVSSTTRIAIAHSDLQNLLKYRYDIDLLDKPERVMVDSENFKITVEWTSHENIAIKSPYR